ncbi:YhcH/YjgK/YiaL family protein [Lachnospiraceae bacterium 62-35]
MIFGNIYNLREYSFLEKQIRKCFAYAESHSLKEYEKGTYEIDGRQVFVNIAEYMTTSLENRFWEAHRKYLDVHLMLSGREQIDLNFIENMGQGEFVEKDDFLPLEGEKNSTVVLKEGDFLICFPSDGHRTGVAAEEPEMIKKAIFKIQI